jgi:hypothetical protein
LGAHLDGSGDSGGDADEDAAVQRESCPSDGGEGTDQCGVERRLGLDGVDDLGEEEPRHGVPQREPLGNPAPRESPTTIARCQPIHKVIPAAR